MVEQVTGEGVIDAILSNATEGTEPVRYRTLVPSRFQVYLHPDDYERLESIFNIIVEDAERALDEELKRLNKRSHFVAVFERLFKGGKPKYQIAEDGWSIEFQRDLDDELERGEVQIESQLALPPKLNHVEGTETKRVTTRRSGGESKTVRKDYENLGRLYATLTYEDDHGQHTYRMTKDEIVIGRGGKGFYIDLKVYASPDVSREHLRIIRNTSTDEFYVRDLSTLGTTVNGRAIASSVDMIDDEKHDKGVDVALPQKSRIGLADVVFLEFEAEGKK